jgi:rRNA maturation RNase YbeY
LYSIKIFNDSGVPKLPIKKATETIENVFRGEGVSEATVNLIYIDSEPMAKMNMEYLGHEGVTDVITFPLDEETIEGEIYVCPQQAEEQAKDYNAGFKNELLRLAAHGALHLCGYDDDTDEKRAKMNELETKYIQD